jgi:A/G-specific adenine glycosylase
VRVAFAAALLAFYDAGKRDLPWRRQPDAYRTLVSELMLQQTVVATVVPYFERFVARFPDVASLAAAREEEVLALWSGLGYYARGRNLHRAAQLVVARHGGALPASEQALRELPGVGPYTAAAVAAIAFGARTLALDGNVARVLARLLAVDEAIDRPAVREALRARGTALVPARRSGDFAQAMMELGALVCTPSSPRCGGCPVTGWCQARQQGRQQALPVRAPKRARPLVRVACAAVVRAGRVLLVRRARGLLAGTWTLPAAELAAGDEPEQAGVAAARGAAQALGLTPAGAGEVRGSIRHVFTHRDVTAWVYQLRARGRPVTAAEADLRWVDPRAPGALALSTFTRKTLALVGEE